MDFFRSSNLEKYLRNHNGQTSYALITGASDGIGAGFASELASRGFNLILHGRNPTKLYAVRDSILKTQPSTQIHLLIADASQTTPAMISTLLTQLTPHPITVLINNVGGTGALDANFKTFATHTTTEIDALLNINIRFPLLLTHALLPHLKTHSPALLMNIGSQAASGTPYLSVYGGTKGFVHAWTRGLSVELAGEEDDIEVIEIIVASVQTNQNQTDKPTLFVPDSVTMARSALDRAGRGSTSVAPYWPHNLQLWGMWAMPAGLKDMMTVKFLKPLAGKTERKW